MPEAVIVDTIRTPTSGTVRLLGMDVTKRKRDILPRIGVLPQGFTSFDRITVTETIQYYSRLFSRRHTDVEGLIELVNLQDRSQEQFQNLSGGLKQRLGIAVALVNDPEVVFLDEPTIGVDPVGARELRTKGVDDETARATLESIDPEDERDRARETAHSTALEAAGVARAAEVELLALTHLSNRYFGPEIAREAREIFPDTVVPKDFDVVEVPFAERGTPQLVKGGALHRREPEAVSSAPQ